MIKDTIVRRNLFFAKIETCDIEKLNIDTESEIDTFATHLTYIVSRHAKKNGRVTVEFIEKLKLCIKQVNESAKNKMFGRTYEIHEEHSCIAFLRNRQAFISDTPFALSLVLEKVGDKWKMASPEGFHGVKRRILLSNKLCI